MIQCLSLSPASAYFYFMYWGGVGGKQTNKNKQISANLVLRTAILKFIELLSEQAARALPQNLLTVRSEHIQKLCRH